MKKLCLLALLGIGMLPALAQDSPQISGVVVRSAPWHPHRRAAHSPKKSRRQKRHKPVQAGKRAHIAKPGHRG
jgi:hypothetical protein